VRPINTTRLALLLSALGLGAACAAGSATNHPGQSSSGGGTTGTSSTGGSGAGGERPTSSSTGPLFDSGFNDGPISADSGCGLITVSAQVTPLDLYIALDQSSAMTGENWTAATAGLQAFVNDPGSAGIRVALNFFPLPMNPTCNQMEYEPPVVPFGFLPQNAQALVAALTAAMPDGFYETIYPALGGALLAGITEASNNPSDAVAVLLVTDGVPDGPPIAECGGANPDDPAASAMLAATAAGYDPPVKTFVVGLPGVNQTFANQVAAAGGTGSAIQVSVNNVQTDFENALATVRGQAIPCTYDLPAQVAGGQIDTSDVNVLVTIGGGTPTVLPQNAACNGAGWAYDNPAHPQHISLCATTCAMLKATANVTVQIVLGCPTEVAS
jgi:hypothetical protein